jgi:hypothetical protein
LKHVLVVKNPWKFSCTHKHALHDDDQSLSLNLPPFLYFFFFFFFSSFSFFF